MGKLRTEPKTKPALDDVTYGKYFSILQEAQDAADEHHIFWDLGPQDNPNQERKNFMLVAEKEGIPVTIRRARGKSSLTFKFRNGGRVPTSRMSAAECQNRIMQALARSDRPLQKSEIIDATGISPSTWNIRIRELIDGGKVKREGQRRDTKYMLTH